MKIQDDSVEDLSVEMMLNNNNNRGETQLVCDIIVIGMRSMHETERITRNKFFNGGI